MRYNIKYISLVLAFMLSACGGEASAGIGHEAGDSSPGDAHVVDAWSGPTCPPEGPCENAPARCEQLWSPDPLPNRPWWLADPPETCSTGIAHGAPSTPEALDDCPASPFGVVPSACGIPAQGAATCAETDYWTQTCHVSGDCPLGMACVDPAGDGRIYDTEPVSNGLCRQRCGARGQPICVRCEEGCAPEGYCTRLPPPPGKPCTADCECMPGKLCGDGFCYVSSHSPSAICAGPETEYQLAIDRCSCNAGTCEVNARTGRGCCYDADGTIARTQTSSACQ